MPWRSLASLLRKSPPACVATLKKARLRSGLSSGKKIEIGRSPIDEQLAADLALPVEDLNLTVRSYNCLKREGIHTVSELVSRSEQDLLDIRNFGSKSIDEVKLKLHEMGLSLKDSAPGFDPLSAIGRYDDIDEDDVDVSET